MRLSLYREVGDRVLISTALSNLARAANDRWTIDHALSGLGRLAGRQGDVEKGCALLAESLVLFEQVRDRRNIVQ